MSCVVSPEGITMGGESLRVGHVRIQPHLLCGRFQNDRHKDRRFLLLYAGNPKEIYEGMAPPADTTGASAPPLPGGRLGAGRGGRGGGGGRGSTPGRRPTRSACRAHSVTA